MSINIIDVIDRLKTRIGVEGPPQSATVEAGHVRRFAEAIGDPNPRWRSQAPPTFLVALAAASMHLDDAEEFGKGWLNGGNRFEYFAPVMFGDQVTARSHVADVYDKAGSSGDLLFIIFETEYVNQRGELVARLRGTAIRR
jgi:N-terminal half of MaoC dehydratase